VTLVTLVTAGTHWIWVCDWGVLLAVSARFVGCRALSVSPCLSPVFVCTWAQDERPADLHMAQPNVPVSNLLGLKTWAPVFVPEQDYLAVKVTRPPSLPRPSPPRPPPCSSPPSPCPSPSVRPAVLLQVKTVSLGSSTMHVSL
jgi:hypothetical protein